MRRQHGAAVYHVIWIALILASCAVLANLAFIRHAGAYLAEPGAAPLPADLIVSLGGGGARPQKAAELYRAGYGAFLLITSNEPLHEASHGRDTGDWRVPELVKQGVRRESILHVPEPINSWEEAVATLEVMRRHGWTRVIVVSDPPHLRRLQWAWGKVFAGSGKHFRLVATNLPGWSDQTWYEEKPIREFVMREYVKMVYYYATKRAT